MALSGYCAGLDPMSHAMARLQSHEERQMDSHESNGHRYRDPRELRAEADRLRATATAIEDGTWAWLVESTVGTPIALAAHLGISVPAANNRLRKLYDLGITDREHALVEGGGRTFVYSLALRKVE